MPRSRHPHLEDPRSLKRARSDQGRRNYESGLSAERTVTETYRRQGLSVEGRRWRGQAGELDLVMRDGNTLVFAEVKQARCFDRALESLRPRQIERLYACVEEYVQDQIGVQDVRFDLALVDGRGECRIMENIFAMG